MPSAGPRRRAISCLLAAALVLGCADDGPQADTTADDIGSTADDIASTDTDSAEVAVDSGGPPVPIESWACPITSYALSFDLASDTGSADITAGKACAQLSLAAAGLTKIAVEALDPADAQVVAAHVDGRLDIAAGPEIRRFRVTWAFQRVFGFNGLSKSGSTVLWPDHCGNLFPCRPSMAEAATYTMQATGAPAGQVVVLPAAIPADAPAYMPALAIGDYTWHDIGATKAGVKVGYWTLPSTVDAGKKIAADLLKVVQWLETTLGPYPFGKALGPVPVNWGMQYGGLENHPYWHVSTIAFGDLHVHAHEAAHGWYGSGIRLACWEDLVMSEGTADYLAARALGALKGKQKEDAVFAGYQTYVDAKVKAGADRVIWPEGCGGVDVDNELLHQLVYKKGALFWRDVGDKVGRGELDGALGSFFVAHANKAAKMVDLLAHVHKATGFDPAPLVAKWLRSKR